MYIAEIASFKCPRRSARHEHSAGRDRKQGRGDVANAPIVHGRAADGSPHPSTDQRRNIDKREIRAEPSRGGEIARFPRRVEFPFESAQALKVIVTASERPDHTSQTMPARRQAMRRKAREWQRAEAECAVALF